MKAITRPQRRNAAEGKSVPPSAAACMNIELDISK
jgi:hypothetical protein